MEVREEEKGERGNDTLKERKQEMEREKGKKRILGGMGKEGDKKREKDTPRNEERNTKRKSEKGDRWRTWGLKGRKKL